MARPYVSQLPFMHSTYLKDNERRQLFDEVYMEKFDEAFSERHRNKFSKSLETFAILQYLAEKRTWEVFWPHTAFPGIDPSVIYDGSTWEIIREAGDKMKAQKFEKSWMDCLLTAMEKYPHERTEIQQYEAEKMWWKMRWPRNEFPGIDPRPFLDRKNMDLASWKDIKKKQKADEPPKKPQPVQLPSNPAEESKEPKELPSQNVLTKREWEDKRASEFVEEMFQKLNIAEKRKPLDSIYGNWGYVSGI